MFEMWSFANFPISIFPYKHIFNKLESELSAESRITAFNLNYCVLWALLLLQVWQQQRQDGGAGPEPDQLAGVGGGGGDLSQEPDMGRASQHQPRTGGARWQKCREWLEQELKKCKFTIYVSADHHLIWHKLILLQADWKLGNFR